MSRTSNNSNTKQTVTNIQTSYSNNNNRQKCMNQEKQTESNTQNDNNNISGASVMQIQSFILNQQDNDDNSDKKQLKPQNENFLKSQFEQEIKELQNQLNYEKEQYSKNLKKANDEHNHLTNQIMQQNEKDQRDLKYQLLSAKNQIQELHKKEQQLYDQNNQKSQEQNKIKILNDDLNRKYKQLENELSTYKLNDQQQKQQIQTLTNQQTQISQLLQNTKSSLEQEQYCKKQLESRAKEAVIDYNNLQFQTQKKYEYLEQQKKEQQQSQEKKIKELEQQIKQQRVNQDSESSNINLEQFRENFKIESEKYNKLLDDYQRLQKTNYEQTIQIYGFEPTQLDLICKVSEAEFKTTQLQNQLTDALKQIAEKNQQIIEFQKQKCESIQDFNENDIVENTNLQSEEIQNTQQRIVELKKTQQELEDENHQLKQKTLDQEKEYQEQLQIKNKQFYEIQIKSYELKNQVVQQNKTIEDLKYQLKQKDREIEKKIMQISEYLKQQQKVERNYQTPTNTQANLYGLGTSENQMLKKLQDFENKVKLFECEKENLASQCEDRIKKQNNLVNAIKLRCQQLENKLQQIQNQILECNKELRKKEQKIRDQELEIAMLSGSHSKPYIDESKNCDIKQSQNSQTVTNEFSSKQMTQSLIQQRPQNQISSSSKSPKVIPDFQIDLNNKKYSITLLLGKNDNGKQQIMKTLFENNQYDLYQANLEAQSQTLVINTDSFDFDDIDEREKQIKEYKKVFNKYANKQFNFWIVIPFVRTDFMKKDIMDIYKYFHKLKAEISIIVTDFHLSENQNEDEQQLRSKFTLYKPREILFIANGTNKNQLIQMLKSNLSKEDTNNLTQLTIKDTIFQDEDEEEQQNITKQLNRLSY